MRNIFAGCWSALFGLLLFSCEKQTDKIDPFASLYSDKQIISNIEYSNVDSVSLVLDAYVPAKRLGQPPWYEYSETRKPVVLYFHGGAWVAGDKISHSRYLLPYVDKKWCVVNVNYRHLDKTSLIGIISDARSALNWIYENAEKYKFDTTKIIVTGESSGGHLALMTGLALDETLFSQGHIKPGRKLKVVGVINWFGVTDLILASVKWDSAYVNAIIPNRLERTNSLRDVSPTNYITKSSVPVMTIHGDQDMMTPHDQGVMLHDKLKAFGIKNNFLTIHGKGHGNFDGEEMTMIFNEIWRFLKEIEME